MLKDVVVTSGPIEVEAPEKASQENRKQRAYLNTITSMIDYVGAQLTGLIVSPFIVHGLGGALYGVWQMLGQMTGYSKLADSRATQVLKWTIAKKKDVASADELRSDLTSALIVTLVSLPVVLIIGGFISWYAPVITKADPAHYFLIRCTSSILILSMVVTRVFDLFECVLRGMNLSYKRMGFRAGIILAGGALKVLAITLGYGLIGLSVVQVFIALITGLTFYFIVKKHVPWLGIGKTNFKKVLSFTKLSGWNMANTTSVTLLSQSDKILLGVVAGPVLVASYSLTLFLPLAIQGIIFNIITGAIPGVGSLIGRKEHTKVYEAWHHLNNIILLLVVAAGSTVIIFNAAFLQWWVGGEHYAGHLANALIMVIVVQELFIKHDGYVITATLDMKKKVYLTLLSVVLSITIGAVLINMLGIAGLCIGLFVGRMFLFIMQRKILREMIRAADKVSILNAVQPLLMALLMFAGSVYLSAHMGKVSLLQMAGWVPLTFLLAFLVYFKLGISAESRIAMQKIYASINFFKTN